MVANGRGLKRKDSGRDPGRFIALPNAIVDSPAYLSLSMHARALLIELARQYMGSNNGQLLLTKALMEGRGWFSGDTLNKAKKELIRSRLVFEMVHGRRPNKASWYAVCWQSLDASAKFDEGASERFQRNSYKAIQFVPTPKPAREQLYARWNATAKKIAAPSGGTQAAPIAPCKGSGLDPLGP